MKRSHRIVRGFAAYLAFLAGLAWAGLEALAYSMCDNTVVEKKTSPEGGLEAVVFVRNCGATTGFSTHVSVQSSGRELANRAGNVFTAGSGEADVRPGPAGGPEAHVEWLSSDTLLIRYDDWSSVFQRRSSHMGVSLRYRRYSYSERFSP